MHPLRLALLPLVLAAAPLVGCGEGPTVTGNGDRVQVTLTEYRIAPARLRVAAGPVRLEAVNRGILTHNLRLEAETGDEPEEPIQLDTMHPGQRTHETVRLAAGRYRMVCTIANHADLGQFGTLTVR